MEHSLEPSAATGQGAGNLAASLPAHPPRHSGQAADENCRRTLACCRAAAETAAPLAKDDPELQRTLAELALLCRTARQALDIDARTTRELRLICAALCHLCAEQCSGRAEPWARRLAQRCRQCADACRQVMTLPTRDVA